MTPRKHKSKDRRASLSSKYLTGKDSLAEGHVVITLFRTSRTLRIPEGRAPSLGENCHRLEVTAGARVSIRLL